MPISRAVSDPNSCLRCGQAIRARVWEVVDLQERPDLRSALASGSWATVHCVGCGLAQGRRLPLLVLHLSPEAPIVLGVDDQALMLDDPMAPSGDLLERTQAALRPRASELPGPVIAAPFDVLAFAAARDVGADVLASRQVSVAPRYEVFVDILRASRRQRRLNVARNRLLTLFTIEDLRVAVAEVPELAGPEVLASLTDDLTRAADDEERLIAQAHVDLVRSVADGRIDDAWAGYERALVALNQQHFTPQATELMDQLRAEQSGDASRAVALGEELLGRMHGLERTGFHVEVLLRTAAAYYWATGPGLDDRLDRVIELCQRAVRIIDDGVDDANEQPMLAQERVRALLNQGAAFSRRYRGDPAANHERACDLQREVLREVSLESAPHVWAMASTNLGTSLVHRAMRRTEDDPARQTEIREAVERFEDSLRWRSFDRDPLDWAYTQTGLGLAFGHRRGANRGGDVRAAIEHHRAAARGLEAAGEQGLEAQAWHNVASETVELSQLDGTDKVDQAALLSEAIEACQRSLALRPPEIDPVGAGTTRGILARALELSGDIEGAIVVYRQALLGLQPETAPQATRQEARLLAELAKQVGDWAEAARAYDIAAQATVAALESRADSAGRFEELGQGLNLFRWAAEALIRAGRVQRAVELLEQGRARELAAWLHRDTSTAELRELDPELHDRFVALRNRVDRHERDRREGGAIDLTAAGETQEAYRRTLAEIRALPGFERFLLSPDYSDIAARVPAGEALVYLFSAPEGTTAVIVTRDADPEVGESRELTSGRVVRSLMRPVEHGNELVGYLPAQAGGSEDLDEAIDELSDLLGASLLRPLTERLDRLGAHTVCIVAGGLLALVPLHALSWQDGVERSCLLEHFDVVMAPSAMARETCRRRATERAGRGHLLAVGNPLPHSRPLPWSEQEARMVAQTLPSTGVTLVTGIEATASVVESELPGARFAHLACHGSAAVSPEALDSALYLARDEPLTGADLLELAPLDARLIVASACETAIIPGYETVDEALSLSTVLLGSGAAGVVASLWAVDDFATALLMSRFYEELGDGATPAHALRVGTLWLRDLPLDSAIAYANARPALRAHGARACVARNGEGARPFAAPTLWAAFVISGA
jgi:CHAT domain-containing protein/tetratricopeptide (TPR) repeat protein